MSSNRVRLKAFVPYTTGHLALLALIAPGICAASAASVNVAAQEPELIATFDAGEDLPVLAAWAPDGRRLAYGTERELKSRRARPGDDSPRYYPGEVWLADLDRLNKKPKRLLDYREVRALEYRIETLSWSPDGNSLAAEMTHKRLGTATFFFTAKGSLVKIGGRSRRNFVFGYGGGWVDEGQSYGLLEEAFPPRVLHSVKLLRVVGGRVLGRFPNDRFAAVVWLPSRGQMAAVRRDADFEDDPELVVGTLADGTLETLGAIPDYQGRLATVPGEQHVSYFIGADELAVRPLSLDAIHTSLPVPMGKYKWSPAGDAVYYLEPDEPGENTGRLRRVDRESKEDRQVLVETLWDFWVSPDGTHVAVLTAGKDPVLKVYRLN